VVEKVDLTLDEIVVELAWVLDGARNRASFETCMKKELAHALRPGQFVLADTLSSRKSPRVVGALTAKGCEIIVLPTRAPDPCVAKKVRRTAFLALLTHAWKWLSPS
jgi:hypothetical protein